MVREKTTVYTYAGNSVYPANDPVVQGYYKFLDKNTIYSFLASRLREV